MDLAGQPADGGTGPDAGPAGRGRHGKRPGAERAAAGRRPDAGDGDAGTGSQGRAPRPGEMTGGAGAAAARGVRGGQPRGPGRDRGADDALWVRAAAWQAAAQSRRQARRPGVPYPPSGRREPFRPWFADSADEDLWLNAEGTGEPWFLDDEP